MRHLHVVSPDTVRRDSVKRRLTDLKFSLQTYKDTDQLTRTLSTLDVSRGHLVIYVPPPKEIASYAHELISLAAIQRLGFPVAVICMSTEQPIVETAKVLNLYQILYDAQGTLQDQISNIVSSKQNLRRTERRRKSSLTPREQSVLIGLRAGLSIKEVASNLKISANTVSTYKARIMQKRGFRTNAELLQSRD
jgi:DNA-binding CsgD family transcriptional regulator